MVIVYFSRPGENYWYSDRRDLDVGNTQVVGILATVIAVTIAVEMLPNLLGLIAASIVGTMTAAVIGLTTLSFIGVIPVTNYNWGTILNWASAQGAFQQNQWWWYLPPGLCIAAIGVALSLLNFGIDEYANPRLRSAASAPGR